MSPVVRQGPSPDKDRGGLLPGKVPSFGEEEFGQQVGAILRPPTHTCRLALGAPRKAAAQRIKTGLITEPRMDMRSRVWSSEGEAHYFRL